MQGLGRTLRTLLALAGLGLVLGACSNTATPEGKVRVETYGSRWSKAADGSAVEQNIHAVGYKDVERVPEQDIAGSWYLNDEFERDCIVDLNIAMVDGGKRRAQSTQKCSGLMTHLAAWDMNADGSAIRLYKSDGHVLGQLERSENKRYKGPFTLTTEQVVVATLRPI